MGKSIKDTRKKTSSMIWIVISVAVSLVVALAFVLIILNIAGVNVTGWAKKTGSKVPMVSSLISTNEEDKAQEEHQKSKEIIQDQDEEIEDLNRQLVNLEETIEQLETDILKYKNKIDSEKNAEQKNEEIENEEINTVKKLSGSFKKMNKKQAALIFQDLEQSIAISLLQEVSNDVRGGILEEMEPKQAAELAEVFYNSDH